MNGGWHPFEHLAAARRLADAPGVCQDAGMQQAVDDLDRPARPGADRGQHLPGHQPRRRAPSGSSAARWPARRWWPRPAPSRPTAASTRCTPTSCAPATRPCPSSTRWTASATAAPSPPGGWWPSSTGGPSSTCQASFHVAEEGYDHEAADARPTCPIRESLPDFKQRWAPWADAMGEWYERDRPIDSRNVDWEPAGPQASRCPRASASGCEPTACCPTTRCCTPAS